MDHNIYNEYITDFKNLLEQGDVYYVMGLLTAVIDNHSSSGLIFLVNISP
jgi:hypothetical protein